MSTVTDSTGKTITSPSVADRHVIGDPNNRLTTIFSYNDFSDTVQIDQVFDAQTLTTTMNYGPLGRLVKQTDPMATTPVSTTTVGAGSRRSRIPATTIRTPAGWFRTGSRSRTGPSAARPGTTTTRTAMP